MFGYDVGVDAMSKLLSGDQFKKFLRAAAMLGMVMMGTLTAAYCYLTTPLTIVSGEAAVSIQEVIDGIVPGLLPLAAVMGIYYIMKNKTQKFGLIAIGVVVVCLVLSFFGIV
jgi:D-glucosaminate-specific PTS system IID component